MNELRGIVVTPEGERPGLLRFGERIEALEALPEAPRRYLLPGCIDLHVHGGGGADCMDGEEAIRQMARFHARNGTTALLATTVTAPPADLEAALVGIRAVVERPEPGEARVLGVHLEGPFINANKLGAQPPYAIPPDLELMRRWLGLAPIKVVTLAPELPGALGLIRFLSEQGVRVQIGHTLARYDQALQALEAGVASFTHCFNAMTPLHHREPGVAGLALERARWAEFIADGLHVHPATVRAAWKAIPEPYVVTDAVAAAGMPEGPYHMGRHRVIKRGDGVYLEDGSALAGSALTTGQAIRNLVDWGYSLCEVVRATSATPAAYLGLAERGHLRVGAYADILVLNANLEVEEVYVQGQRIQDVPRGTPSTHRS
ncbi:N-acetylglucosamine-6-phosphate deacetylase [Calidithermus timidus]|jgi:N-acetylglucosamine-6-phosphate deacetylase|uniref:N-acetylglucosamine-6-phosphate deacetylase n=1 Tax=Calidithermus timidus TaxID=307124 RepID=UPI000364DAC2|nr:N-acetylglucosamine-6-phosphate deacetylase [Calidithermus timidus]